MRLLVCTALTAALAACTPLPGGPCTTTDDCISGEVCTRMDECLPSDQVRAIRVSWTFDGVPPSPVAPGGCAGVDHIVIELDSGNTPITAFSPVDCLVASVLFDRMPTSIDAVEIATVDAAGTFLVVRRLALPSGNPTQVTFELSP